MSLDEVKQEVNQLNQQLRRLLTDLSNSDDDVRETCEYYVEVSSLEIQIKLSLASASVCVCVCVCVCVYTYTYTYTYTYVSPVFQGGHTSLTALSAAGREAGAVGAQRHRPDAQRARAADGHVLL